MANLAIDAFVIPTDDPHMSEYTASHYARREFVSGFTGSAGSVVVTKDKAILFTDGRYHAQAEQELSVHPPGEWTLMKSGLVGVPTISEFLAKDLQQGAVVGVDPLLHAQFALQKLSETLYAASGTTTTKATSSSSSSSSSSSGSSSGSSSKKITLKMCEKNIVDEVWGNARPPAPSGLVRVHPLQYAGKSLADKMQDVRAAMAKEGASALVSTTLDEIMWLYNIRGEDVPCNPVAVAYSLLTKR